MDFYKSLGYTEQMLREGIEAEFFVWSKYRREGSASGEFCLQAKIVEYLIRHSPKFQMDYQDYLETRSKNCGFHDELNEECRVCKMRTHVT